MKIHLVTSVFLTVIFFTGCRDSKQKQEHTMSPAQTQAASPEIAAPERVPIPEGTAEEGRKVFERIKSKYSNAEISIWGAGTSTPKVALWIPESEWKSLSDLERCNLGYYLKSSVPAIRSNPGPHIGISSSAPIYAKLISNCRNMTEDSWMIGVGAINAEGKLLLNHEAANGFENPWHANKVIIAPPLVRPATIKDAVPIMTTWTSADGRTIQATMLQLQGENVILQRSDGAVFQVPLVNLSPESQTKAKKLRD